MPNISTEKLWDVKINAEHCRMKSVEKGTRVKYKSIKIREEHYSMAKSHKDKTGVNIDFFIGQAIVEKLAKFKK